MGRRFFCILIVTTTSSGLVICQDLDIHGQFQVDSIEIGAIFPYSLSLKYPKDYNILFPDSSYSFSPFELHHKTFFPTRTQGTISYDSVVYFLSSFELDSVQKLRLPVFIVQSKDCTQTIYAREDSVILRHLVAHVPDSISAQKLPLKTNTLYQNVRQRLNYPLLITISGIVAVIGIGVWLLFGKRIRKYFLIRKLNRRYLRFTHAFEESVKQTQLHYSIDAVQSAVLIWKKYMEALLTEPFTKYTSKEIFQAIKSNLLYEALKQIDQHMYSRKSYQGIEDDLFWRLQDFSDDCFQKKIKKVKNG